MKNMYWLVRFTCFLCLFAAGVSADNVPDGDAILAQKYAEFNRRWFDDKLPVKNIEIGWGDSTGTYYTNYEDEGFHAGIAIIRKVEGYDNRVCMEILHEMVHLKLVIDDKDFFVRASKNTHEAAFQEEMLNLAKRGAFADCW